MLVCGIPELIAFCSDLRHDSVIGFAGGARTKMLAGNVKNIRLSE